VSNTGRARAVSNARALFWFLGLFCRCAARPSRGARALRRLGSAGPGWNGDPAGYRAGCPGPAKIGHPPAKRSVGRMVAHQVACRIAGRIASHARLPCPSRGSWWCLGRPPTHTGHHRSGSARDWDSGACAERCARVERVTVAWRVWEESVARRRVWGEEPRCWPLSASRPAHAPGYYDSDGTQTPTTRVDS
jgi:hypothetical protein